MISILTPRVEKGTANALNAVEVNQSGQLGTAPALLVGPKIAADVSPIVNMGSVFDAGAMIGRSPALTSFTYLLNNSGGGAAVNYLMFDSNGFFANNSGLAVSAPTSGSSSVAGIKAMTAVAPLILKGYNYQVTASANQFNNDLKIVRGDADGSYYVKPIPTAQAKRNTQYIATLLTFETAIYIDSFSGLLLTVNAGETVSLTFMVGVNYNRQ